MAAFGYAFYLKYSPLAELADCGKNCIDFKKVHLLEYETPVPDIKIVDVDVDTLILDIPIIIHNPSIKDMETTHIDFDVYMEGRHLSKGMIPANELPARQNTTILIEDVKIKYEELGEVFQVLIARHGLEMVNEGKANISTIIDLLIYFPIEIFGINIYTFTIPVTIETDVPVDMFRQKEETERQIEEAVIGTVIKGQETIIDTPPIPPLEEIPEETDLPVPVPTFPQWPKR